MRILLFISAIFFAISSFASSNNDSLPDKAKLFIDNHFTNNTIVKVKYDDNEWEVKLNNACEIKFDLAGNWIEIESDFTPLPKSIIDLLPKPIIAYIANKYPRRAIMKIEKEGANYEIELSNSVELIFDKKGKFLRKD